MDNRKLGINDQGLETLVKELDTKSEIISDKIVKIQANYARLTDCCSGAKLVSDDFMNNLGKTLENIEANIASYASDLRALQNKMDDADLFTANMLEQAAMEETAKNSSFDEKSLIGDNKKGRDR